MRAGGSDDWREGAWEMGDGSCKLRAAREDWEGGGRQGRPRSGGGHVEQEFFEEVVDVEYLVDLHEAGAASAVGDLGGEVATFEADETARNGEVGVRRYRGVGGGRGLRCGGGI
jgi:hypothetical protein